MILQGARSLGVEGMERLVADLKAAILSALAGGSPGAWPDACPRCGCARVVRCFLSIRSDQKYHQEVNIPMICFCTSRSRDMASLRT